MAAKILITRDKRRSQKLIEALACKGVSAVAVRMTEIHPIAEADQLPDLSGYPVIAFTSLNAVQIFVDILEKLELQLGDNVYLAAVGSVTAEGLRARFGRFPIIVGKTDGAELADTILSCTGGIKPVKILWVCAEKTAGDFLKTTESAGLKIDRLPVYRNISRSHAVLKKELKDAYPWDLIFFGAPSQVQVFVDVIPNTSDVPCVAIGQTTGVEMVKLGFRNITVSESPSIEDVVSTIVDVISAL